MIRKALSSCKPCERRQLGAGQGPANAPPAGKQSIWRSNAPEGKQGTGGSNAPPDSARYR